MEITKTFYPKNRKQWREWLRKNHKSAPDIWLIYYSKSSGKPRVPYNDAVEEALCFGWIDSTMKPVSEGCFAQRFSPRRKNSKLSELNKERVRRLIKARKMTRVGLESIQQHLDEKAKKSPGSDKFRKFIMPKDILKELKADALVWKNFQQFPEHYKQIRVGWIDGSRNRPEAFQKRLQYFLEMTAKNKKFGMVQ